MNHEIILEQNFKNGGQRKCWVDGVEYPSLSAMYRALRVSESLVYRFRYHNSNPGSSQELAISMAIDYADEFRAKCKARAERYALERERRRQRTKDAEFVFDGKVYSCFPECVRQMSHEFGISLNAESIKVRAKKNGYSLAEQLTLTIYKHYKRKKKLEEEYGVSYANCY